MGIPELVVLTLIVLNFGISWFNAYSVGRSWADSKAIGGWPRIMVWCGAVMSASGFTWCYLVLLAMIAVTVGALPMRYVRVVLELGYVVVILPVLGSGIAIWMDSLTTAWRRRDAASLGAAAWNTFAMAHNTYDAATNLPEIFTQLGSALAEGDDDAEGILFTLAIIPVILVLGSGVLTTAAIIRSTARQYAQSVLAEHSLERHPTKAA